MRYTARTLLVLAAALAFVLWCFANALAWKALVDGLGGLAGAITTTVVIPALTVAVIADIRERRKP